jgi:large subunit ribosomal protein L18
MNTQKAKKLLLKRRAARVRVKISGTAARPRLNVFRSNTGLYLQLIDDVKGVTLASAHTRELKEKKVKKSEAAMELGKLIAKRAAEKNIKQVVFDRGGNLYTGRVKAAAEGAREGGLEF